MGRAKPQPPDERRRRAWPRRPVQRQPSPLVHLLARLEREFPTSLADLITGGMDPGLDLADTLVALIARLLREHDPRARLLAEILLEAYPYRPIAHWLWGRALAQEGSYARAAAVLRNLLEHWPDFPARACVQAQLDSLP